MKKRKNTTAFVLFLAALFLLLGFSSCSAPEPNPPLTDEEALRGQWAVYYADVGASNGTGTSDEPGTTGEPELEFGGIIDIEYTLPGYWLMGFDFESEPTDPSESEPIDPSESEPIDPSESEPIDPSESEPIDPYKITEITGGYFIKSNRTQSKVDGSFSVSFSVEGIGYTIEYKFTDAERNTMEAKVMPLSDPENAGSGEVSQSEGTENEVYIMKRLIDHEIKVNMDFLLILGK